jgi:predicted lipid carrier protein YhbT
VSARRKTADPTADFFGALAERGHEPLLDKAEGTIRVEVVDGKRVERWLLSIDHGDVTVSRKSGAADATVRADKAVFDDIARGKANAMASFLRGALTIDGDPEPLVFLQRLFPGPPRRRRRPS